MSEISAPLLVRRGENVSLGYDRDGNPLHTRLIVTQNMILDICMTYSGLPDVRTMDLDDIEFFYEGIRPKLLAETRPQ
jgi:hypothetical protein